MKYCCINCFENNYIKEYIQKNGERGICDYCKSYNVNIISTKRIGKYMRKCLDKAYEEMEEGTGVYYDSEDGAYHNAMGGAPFCYSVREILTEEEEILSLFVMDPTILDDIFRDSGLSYEEKKDGEVDIFEDIESCSFVIKNDLYGLETTKMYYSWELFKYTTKYYNRFFDIEEMYSRKDYLDQLQPYILEYEKNIIPGTVFFRARKLNSDLLELDDIGVYKEMSPAPPKFAKTNRMSPAGISYLYLASDRETAYAECRLKGMKVAMAEYVSEKELAIIDFSERVFVNSRSIFSEEYDHDLQWINKFLDNFLSEITSPVSDETSDHSSEYVSTQVIAEYIRSLGYDGICFNSSVGKGKSYVFFCGPNMEYSSDCYEFEDEYLKSYFPRLRYFTDWFSIRKLEYNYVFPDGIRYIVEREKIVK